MTAATEDHEEVPPRPPVPPSERAETYIRQLLADMQSGDQLPPVAVIAANVPGGKVSAATVSKVLGRMPEVRVVRSWGSFKR